MNKLQSLLPDYKTMITKCIQSSITVHQLLVCFDFIELFQDRYKKILAEEIYLKHVNDLLHEYESKQSTFII